jgi:ribosome biogenesis protein SSF1/2
LLTPLTKLTCQDEEEDVEVRHYAVRANPTGVNRSIKRVVQAKIPNLSKVDDIADYVVGTGGGMGGAMSDSEGEDESSQVILPQKFVGKGNAKSQKR